MDTKPLQHLRPYADFLGKTVNEVHAPAVSPEDVRAFLDALLDPAQKTGAEQFDEDGVDTFDVHLVNAIGVQDHMSLQVSASISVVLTHPGESQTHDHPGYGPEFDQDFEFKVVCVTEDGTPIHGAMDVYAAHPRHEELERLVGVLVKNNIDWEKYEEDALENSGHDDDDSNWRGDGN